MVKKLRNPENFNIPIEIIQITTAIEEAGFEAYLVGGCVRDLLLGIEPKDWDITTNAIPEQIISIFPKTFYENTFGTVAVVNEDENVQQKLKIVEVTPFRLETKYSDNRHPDSITFSNNLDDDLKRRDFTINALAYSYSKGQVIDLYKGQEDLRGGVIRAVGDAGQRFKEDALRILRSVRFAAQLGFMINSDTEKALLLHVKLLKNISKERIRDEFIKILNSNDPMLGLAMAQKLGMLGYICPDLERAVGVKQNQAHAYEVWEHLLRTVQCAADKNFSLEIRTAALFHDIAKPHTKRFDDHKKLITFYGHDVVGARIAKKTLEDLKFPKKFSEKVEKLVRWHMFFSDTEQITLSAVRRLIVNVGKENIWDLMNLRLCDRVGTGRPKESPYRLRKYHAMIEEATRDPLTVGMLKIDGRGVAKAANINPGPKIGHILHALLEEVLENPSLNTATYLEKRSSELSVLAENELENLGKKGRDAKEKTEEKNIEELRKKYWVK